jgi:predicted double-glycine peptidase
MGLKGKCIDFPVVAQEKDHTCGTACVKAYLLFNKIKSFSEEKIAKLLHSNPKWGTSYKDIVSFFDNNDFQPIVRHKLSIKDLFKILDSKRPLLICLQAWADGKNPNYKDKWDDGHYVVVVGYDTTNVYFMDPYAAPGSPSLENKYAYIPTHEFMDRWHDWDGPDDQVLDHFGIMVLNLGNINPPTKPINEKMAMKMK